MGINYLEHKVDENFISKGCYKFSVEKNNNPNLSYETMPFLTLTYKTDGKHTIFRLDAHYSQPYLCAVTFNNNDYDKRKSKLSGGI